MCFLFITSINGTLRKKKNYFRRQTDDLVGKQNTLGGAHPFVWLQDPHPLQHRYKSAAMPQAAVQGEKGGSSERPNPIPR